MQKIAAKASIAIQKPIQEVFDGIINPTHMTQYFIANSTGILAIGKSIEWTFPEFEDPCLLTVTDVVPNQKIEFVWDPETIVSIQLTAENEHSTIVKIIEDGKEPTEKGIKWAIENTEGWANCLACMKAYLEYGIQLRKGAFDFMKK